MEKYEINKYINLFKVKLDNLKYALHYDELLIERKNIDNECVKEDFWQDNKRANDILKRLNDIKEDIYLVSNLETKLNEILELEELLDQDNEYYLLIEDEIKLLNTLFKDAEEVTLLSGEYDNNNCYLEIHPGAGGVESQDFALILFRMYERFFQKYNFKYKIIDYQEGLNGIGLKSVTIFIEGKKAYGLLKSESGVHRLVRISPFDASKKRHTSFASVDISPEVLQKDVVIQDNDLRIDVYHSQGAGGQSVNTTDSAVRITHIPSGIVVTCQNERSQLRNKEFAMSVLRSRLFEKQMREQMAELEKFKGQKSGIMFGSQIRSYILCPYTLVKDHRSNYEETNAKDVLDGNIYDFIYNYLKFMKGNSNE